MSSGQDSPRSATKSPLKSLKSLNNSFAISNLKNSFGGAKNGINFIEQRQSSSVIEDNSSLYEQNKKLRRKLKQLSQRLDDELQRAAENKLKMQNLSKLNHPVKPQSQTLQLQNAYKMIERLQKAVKDFENKESYQISVKRIMDLESIIKKKQNQTEQLKQQIKTTKKIIRDKEKHINQLLQNAKKDKNVTEDKELIDRMKKKLKKLTQENETLRKKQMTKHQQLVKAQRKLVQIQQEDQMPIGKQQELLDQLQETKKKYKQAMQRVQKQNIYITKLNEKLNKDGINDKSKGRRSEGDKSRTQVSKSLDQLPSLKKASKIKPSIEFIEHLPTPKVPIKLKRY